MSLEIYENQETPGKNIPVYTGYALNTHKLAFTYRKQELLSCVDMLLIKLHPSSFKVFLFLKCQGWHFLYHLMKVIILMEDIAEHHRVLKAAFSKDYMVIPH